MCIRDSSNAMGVVTRYQLPFSASFESMYSPAITLSIARYFSPLLTKILSETGYIKLPPDKAKILSEKIEKRLLTDPPSRSFLSLWMLSHVSIDGSVLDKPLMLSYDFAQTVSKLCGFDLDSLKKYGLILKEKSSFMLSYVHDFMQGKTRVDIKTFLRTSVGRAIYLTYLAAITSGTPAIRAQELTKNEVLQPYLNEIALDAALALILLGTASDNEIKPIAKLDVNQLRKLISETLVHLVIGDVPIEVGHKRKIITLDEYF